MKKSLLILSLLMSGCAIAPLSDNAKNVNVVFDNTTTAADCQPLDTAVGSEGHWYSYWFVTNDDLSLGAINRLRNYAAEIGGNRVELSRQMFFKTSVTFVGHIYHCPTK
uniref:DUF4156 domain-containing protein n=1 Tax=Thaumasiovibrio occultus TaxID=1891184 RepID=UPI00131C2C00|nr:DUF4156 domain-containing protein [Thaumasiovibrio occultus]